jgi:alpha-L-rhamnosidase
MTAACGQIKRAGVGGPGSPALAQQEDLYISAGKDNEYFEPKFTFHGFRYLEVSGLSYLPKLDEILGARMNSAVPSAGSTYSSEPYLNQLDEICGWTFLSNLFSVQSDCPAREKFGYGGDINATAEAFIYKYDMSRIYRKAVYDWVDAMDSTRFVDTAPFIGLGYCGISWESAFLNLQYWLWLHYQDSELIRELYEQDKAWMNKVAKIHPDGLVNDGLSDHESLSPVPVELTGSCHYLQAARIMEQFAILMDKVEDASAYHKLAATLRDKIAERFWYQWQKGSKYNEQTRLACLLDFEVLDEPDRFIALKELVSTLEKDDFHVKTGIFGTKALLNSLSKLGRADIAYKVVTQKGFPGWRHMIDQGATTLWETWKESDNVFSQNHPMFGSVSEWYNKWIGGIMPDESKPGSGHFLIHPQIIGSLDSVASNREINGKNIGSKWIRKADEFHFYFDIPEGQGVDWIIPEDKNSVNQLTSESGNPVKVNDQRVSLSPGKHHFIVKLQ